MHTPRLTLIGLLSVFLLTSCGEKPEAKKVAPPVVSAPVAAVQQPQTPMDLMKNSVGALEANAKQAVTQMADMASKAAENSTQPLMNQVKSSTQGVVDQARETGKSALEKTASLLGNASTALQDLTTSLENPELIAQGAQVAQKCRACHDLSDAKKNRLGPYLYGIVGQPAAQVAGYTYSDAHKKVSQEKRLVWNVATLDGYLLAPKAVIPGNRMVFAGLPNKADRDAIIAYLQSLK